ncbi:subtilase domain protein [Mycobacterium kansasii 824]|nr:subtilase domain protein [Mycobacterium kansasii 824]
MINRIVQSAHNPPSGVDNRVGYGLVDPVAALTFNIPAGERLAPGSQSRVITPAPPPPPRITGRATSPSGSSAQSPPASWWRRSRPGCGGRDEADTDRVRSAQC